MLFNVALLIMLNYTNYSTVENMLTNLTYILVKRNLSCCKIPNNNKLYIFVITGLSLQKQNVLLHRFMLIIYKYIIILLTNVGSRLTCSDRINSTSFCTAPTHPLVSFPYKTNKHF